MQPEPGGVLKRQTIYWIVKNELDIRSYCVSQDDMFASYGLLHLQSNPILRCAL